jgi:hypothetical protein
VPGKTTNPDFVYDTPHVTFPSALVPSTDYASEISLKKLTLKDAISELFQDLTTGYTGKIRLELKIGARVAIAAATPDQQLTVTLPLFLSDVEGAVDASGAVVYGPQAHPSDYRQSLLDQLRRWQSGLAGDSNAEAIELDLTVFSSLTTEQLPLVRVRQIEFVVGDKRWWTEGKDFPPPPVTTT